MAGRSDRRSRRATVFRVVGALVVAGLCGAFVVGAVVDGPDWDQVV
jgi:hypothetical protein